MKMITVIGSLNIDLVARSSRIPRAGETLSGTDFNIIPGGKGANQAVAARRAGAPTRMIGCVGEDIFADTLRNSLKDAGVDVSGIHAIAGHPTGTAVILVDDAGENRILIIPGTNGLVSITMVDDAWPSLAQTSMILLQHEIPLETVRHIIERAHHEGIPVMLNAAPFYPIPESTLQQLDVLVINETEASSLCDFPVIDPKSAFDAAGTLQKNGPRTVIITLGPMGSVLVSPEFNLYQPGFPVRVVDTTAAGDTFVGGYAAALWEGKDIPDALQYAAAAATLAVTRLGAQSSIPDKREVIESMKDCARPEVIHF
ncbi:ribokinase [Longilinea arvoryzae]|uniref:Ribokinase n=1 Tax=Longilinea arvoryzae TaxID=360412 RepID=A0A0S7BLT5_9CHLR|nr:ribokinase [Longilinea arvoryzae]GAP14955.1 ribokinase [Longilinea arvoryzae]